MVRAQQSMTVSLHLVIQQNCENNIIITILLVVTSLLVVPVALDTKTTCLGEGKRFTCFWYNKHGCNISSKYTVLSPSTWLEIIQRSSGWALTNVRHSPEQWSLAWQPSNLAVAVLFSHWHDRQLIYMQSETYVILIVGMLIWSIWNL